MDKPRFKVGDIIRYAYGPTALMRVAHVSESHGMDHRYYGDSFHGSPIGAYESDVRPASGQDLQTWAHAFPFAMPQPAAKEPEV